MAWTDAKPSAIKFTWIAEVRRRKTKSNLVQTSENQVYLSFYNECSQGSTKSMPTCSPREENIILTINNDLKILDMPDTDWEICCQQIRQHEQWKVARSTV